MRLKESDNFAMDFKMFSDVGNQEIVNIVKTSKNYKEAVSKLKRLSKKKGFEEALDDEVKDKVSIYFSSRAIL